MGVTACSASDKFYLNQHLGYKCNMNEWKEEVWLDSTDVSLLPLPMPLEGVKVVLHITQHVFPKLKDHVRVLPGMYFLA